VTALRSTLAAVVAGAVAAAPLAAQPVDDPARAPGVGPGVGPTPIGVSGADPNLSDDERAVLRDVEAEYDRYIDAADRHHARLRAVLLGELDRRVAELEKRYAERLAKAGADKARLRANTKALLLKFLEDHPAHEEFTPDARFRLADILLDEADDALDAIEDPTAAVMADYTPSIAQWEQILKDWPQYRQIPSVLYLLAYYGKSIDERRSLQLFLSLTCANQFKYTDPPPPVPTKDEAIARIENKTYVVPYATCTPWPDADPELVRHAWVRGIADYHFNVPGELDGAISGYLQVVDKAKDSSLYAEALYKLAWSYYKRDYLLESIQRFDESVKIYDATIAAGQQPSLELRDESIQYIAVAFTDPWAGETDTDPVKSFDRAREFYKGRETEPHVRDVWVALGNAFLELQAYDQAVDSFRIAIGPPWELHRDNPLVHQQIVDAFELKGDKFAADEAAGQLATRYAPGTPWYTANEKDREAMDNQRRIAERALYASALNTHAAATEVRKEWEAGGRKDEELHQTMLELYESAIKLYQTFISVYPESDYVYQFTFMLGEALFFSGQYLASVEHYKWVRDHRDLSETLFLDAAKSVTAAYEAEVAREVELGNLPALKVYTVAELQAMPQPLEPMSIPALYVQLREEWDDYQELVPDPATAPQQGINAALVSMAYLHLDDAIARFEKVMTLFCGSPEAVQAKDGLLAIHEARNDLVKFSETNDKFIASKCGDEAAIKAAKSQNRSVEFKKAYQLLENKQYIEAAELFYSYYKNAPKDDPDLPTALYNAGYAYRKGDRPKTAISLFKEFTQSTDKAFRQNGLYLDAMELTAATYQGSYDYKAAMAAYLELYEFAKNARKNGIKPPNPLPGETKMTDQEWGAKLNEASLNALYNAAVLAELDRDFKKAIGYYEKYEKEESRRRSKDRAVWAIARIHHQSGDVAKLVAAYDKWRKAYGRDDGNEDDFVYSYYDIGKAYQKKGKTSDSDKYGKLAIDAWATAGSRTNTRGAKLAGEYALLFAERHFDKVYVPYKITKQAKNLDEAKKLKQQLKDATIATQQKYNDLEKYGVAELTMASKVRYGETLALFAEKLIAFPAPKDLMKQHQANPDAGLLAIWEETLQKELKPYLDEARKQWEEVVDAAKKAGVSNQWSQLALENLNREFPDEFPVLHQELFEGTDKP
jgi:tetratricopeptide (TPR) repeat protein